MRPQLLSYLNVFVALFVVMVLNTRRALSFVLSPDFRCIRSLANLGFKKSCISTVNRVDSSVRAGSATSSRETEQDGFMDQMKDWRGSSKSTSEFVTHFIASDCNITIADAIMSVLPKENKIIASMESETRMSDILNREDDKLLSRLETNFRNDPSQFPLYEQLNPLELIAMGSVWFLPKSAPRDPALGLKPVRLEAKNFTSIMSEGDYLRVHHMPRRFPEVHAFDWGKELNEKSNEDGQLPGVILYKDIEKGYIILNKPAGVPVHPTVDNVLENVAGAIGRSIVAEQRSRLEKGVDELSSRRRVINVTGDHNQTINWKKEVYASKHKKKKEPLLYVVAPQVRMIYLNSID